MVGCFLYITFTAPKPLIPFMRTILIVGAGKTSVYLIECLLKESTRHNWQVIVADSSLTAIVDKTNDHPRSEAVVLDITNNKKRKELVKRSDIVVSLMPPHLHILLAEDCLNYKKHLITASYVSDDMKALDAKAKEAGVMFMCEMGLDPGIDHMTASDIIMGVQKVAGKIISFRSYAGGLIAPESDDNPWHYKFTWNPMNIVTAGSSGAKYYYKSKTINLNYKDIFASAGRGPKLEGIGTLEHYPNRDSLKYRELYNLTDAATFIRGTYRYKGFIKAWNILVQLGLTDTNDTVTAKDYASWICNKNGFGKEQPLIQQVAQKMNLAEDDEALKAVEWLGIFDNTPIKSDANNSAAILLDVLQPKWAMQPEDKDLIVMVHEIEYEHRNNGTTKLTSTMTLKGENGRYSAMAKTVGLPMAVLTKLVLTGKVKPPTGVHIPDMPAIYRPVLAELENHGIVFKEEIS